MPNNICVMCREIYDTKDITFEQKLIADENFCADCWDKQIMKLIYEEEEERERVKL
ncbi:MAG TPA: hypothetical protein VJZ68_01170 [Nitrososphaera sp.]|nr:hypothetical protein [Nitrososphaera sp.]